MIASKCFERGWIDRTRSGIGNVDPGLLEKCIYAFELLGLLKEKDPFEFVFKGGTRVAAAKAACLATVLQQNVMSVSMDDLRFDPGRIGELRDAAIKSKPTLNRLKQLSPEAFHYWHVAEKLASPHG